MHLKGKTHCYGDNIDTDRIIPGKYTKTLDLSTLADHVLEDLDPEFKNTVKKGDVLVAGWNFGCGSSREQAPLAIKQSGISVVIARDFARIFYRNAINIGLPVIELPDHDIQTGSTIIADLENGLVKDESSGKEYTATKLPQIMIDILNENGLVEYLKKNKQYKI